MNLAYSAFIPPVSPPDPETLRAALELDPDNATLHHSLGTALLLRNDVDGAMASIERALALSPTKPDLYRALGQVYLIRNEIDVAWSSFQHAIALDPDDIEADAHLAILFLLRGEADEALRLLRVRLETRPDVALLWANLAAALRVRGDAEGAIDAYTRALELEPSWIDVRGDLADVFFTCGRFSEAVAERRRMVELNPQSPLLLNELGATLHVSGEMEEALVVYERAATLCPDWSVPWLNASAAASVLADTARAERLLRCTLGVDRNSAHAHFNLGMVLLKRGDYAEGLREFEWRWPSKGLTFCRPELQVPLWDGLPLAGRSLLVWSEQGYGDIIQFARFLSRIPKDGGRVIVHTLPKLARLMGTVEGVDQVVTDGEWLEADLQFPLVSLPFALGVTLDTLGETPYLRAPEKSTAAEELIPCDGSALNIGCVWASGTFYKHQGRRDCEVYRMAGLASVPGVRLFSMQFGRRAPDAAPYADRMTDLSEVIGDWGTTAAFVERLDLIITVDTAMAHLAGALGKPVWLLLRAEGEWRWLEDRSDSPWYPTMRIYRQSRTGDWTDVFERVERDLRELARKRGCTRRPAPPLAAESIPRTIFIKQYGERRTGTNWLRTLLNDNYHAEVLMHILGDKHSPPVPFDDYWCEAQRNPNPARTFVSRATFSVPSLTTTPLDPEQIAKTRSFETPVANAFISGELRFVISTRDPYAWAASLGWFLGWAPRDEIVPEQRADELRDACMRFNERYAAWLAFAERLPARAFFVRYEDLRADPESVCDDLARACGLIRRSRKWRDQKRTVLPAFWDDDPALRLGQDFDRNGDSARYLSDACREVVAKTIDWPLVERIHALVSTTNTSLRT
ncbi:MAG TPA: tetratricopeptide repeat protein [Thermoanaerobaculia bacterium]|nr:tetratricopeptide repeat protein [Thermoanaerobaculia bacterium]